MNGFNEDNLKNNINNIGDTKKKLIVIICLIIVIAIVTLVFIINRKQKPDDSKYTSIESIMVYNAKKYIENNKISSKIYIPLNYLNIKIDDSLSCDNGSGVLVENKKYTPYLICNRYNSSTIQTIINENKINQKYGTLNGDNPYVLKGDNYQDLGVLLKQNYIANIKNIEINNGINIIKYNILKDNEYVGSLKRIVIAENVIGSSPVIELIGNNTRTISINSHYTESGYKAIDKIDGNITNKVVISGFVDTSKAGTYKINYKVTNSRGKTTSIYRTVIINDNNVDLTINHTISPKEITANGVTVKLSIDGSGYNDTALPNNEKTTSITPTYTVYKNGNYEFIVYDKNGNSEVYTVKIDNVDTTGPVVTCSGLIQNGKTTVVITADDDAKYFVLNNGSSNSEKITDKSYIYNNKYQNVTIKAYDKLDNVTDAICEVKDAFIKGTLTNCKIKQYEKMPVRIISRCKAKDGEYPANSYFPGGASFRGNIKVANKTISFAQYVKGVVPGEIGRLIRKEKIAGLEMFMIIINTFLNDTSGSGSKFYINNGEIWAEAWPCFQVYDQGDYDSLSAERKAVLDEAYNEIKNYVLYDETTGSNCKGYYNSTLQLDINEAAGKGYTLEEMFNQTFFRTYDAPHIGGQGAIWANASIYKCE